MSHTLNVTESQVDLLLTLADNLIGALEDSTSEDEIDLRSVPGVPKTVEQRNRLARLWYALRRLRDWNPRESRS